MMWFKKKEEPKQTTGTRIYFKCTHCGVQCEDYSLLITYHVCPRLRAYKACDEAWEKNGERK